MAEARRSLVRQVVPAVVATLAAGSIALLAVGTLRARRTERDARHMADHILPGERALQELDKAVADLALTAAMAHADAQLAAARDHLDWALELYHPEPGSGEAPHWRDLQEHVVSFEHDVIDEARPGRQTTLTATLPLRMDAVFAALRAHSAENASHVMRTLDGLAATERTAMLAELTLLLLVGSACIMTLVRAARREERAFSRDEALMRRLERTNADLEAFAGRIAHDLRGPLSPILAGSQLIESAPVSTEVRRVAERIERSARKLFAMIDALLTFTRLSGEPCGEATYSIRAVIEETLAGFAEQASQLGAIFDVRIEEVGPVRCEPEIAASMLRNLVENALKYGLDGSSDRVIEVRVLARGDEAVIEIEDHGAGVPSRIRERVFEPLVQGAPGRGGFGIGLATVRRLVEARGGRVELQPGSRGGALFRVTLPRVQPHDEHPSP